MPFPSSMPSTPENVRRLEHGERSGARAPRRAFGARAALAALGLACFIGCNSERRASQRSEPEAAEPKAPSAALPTPDELTPIAVRAQGQLGIGLGHLYLDIEPPPGAKLTDDAPISIKGSGGIGLGFPEELRGPLSSHEQPLKLPIEVADGATGPAEIEIAYFWCTEGDRAVCRREQALLRVDLDLSGVHPGGEARVRHVPPAEAM